MTTTVFDHLGNKFTSIKQMCNYYGITIQQYYNRKSRNWPLEKILTTPISSRPIIPVSDHLGNKFPSIKKLCEHYGISQASYTLRINRGMTKKDALTTPVKNPQSEYTNVRDHLNNKFSTMKEMCDCYGITTKQYKCKLR